MLTQQGSDVLGKVDLVRPDHRFRLGRFLLALEQGKQAKADGQGEEPEADDVLADG